MASTMPPLAEPRSEANPFTAGEVAANARPAGAGGLISVESQRAIAEVQARMMIARSNPRDAMQAMDFILNDCTRPTLAKAAVYQYARGGTDIRGPSIRLAEAIAQRWGNIASGIKEISRHGEYSECVAYAWDLETGFYDERQYQVRHWRDTRQGGYQLTDERDIYELIANFGQRRKRAVLLTVIPGDVVEAALQACERTMTAKADTSPEGIRKMLEAFAEFGVTQPQLEARIQRRLDAIRPAQVVMLEKIYNSLRDGMSQAADWFDAVPEPVPADQPAPPPQQRVANHEPRSGSGGRSRRAAGSSSPPPPPPSDPPPPPPPAEPTRVATGRVQFEA